MDKLKMETSDNTQKNIEKIGELFPNVITEKMDKNGNIVKGINFDLLKQELSTNLVDGEECYDFTWVGKRASIIEGNKAINKALRPFVEESKNWDNTGNIYIEGDNLDVLKLLQESYLGKIKMIYIDPPYNTGTSMLYLNKYEDNEKEYIEKTNVVNEDGRILKVNKRSEGRFHSKWCSMIYARLRIARNLLSEDGCCVFAIDHNELANLITLADEIFGEVNSLWIITIIHKPEGRSQEKFFGTSNEFMLVYSKNKVITKFNNVLITEAKKKVFDKEDEIGKYKLRSFIRGEGLKSKEENLFYPIYVSKDLKEASLEEKNDYEKILPIVNDIERTWFLLKESFLRKLGNNEIVFQRNDKDEIKIFYKVREREVFVTHWIDKKYNASAYGTKLLDNLMGKKLLISQSHYI